MYRGDIFSIQLDGRTEWNVCRDGLLAMTHDVVSETKRQGFRKALISGEGLFVLRVSGVGIMFVTSLGAIVRRDLRHGEQWIVDNGHLVAWNCPYSIERTGGSILSGIYSSEGFVCRFTGPGTVLIQVNERISVAQNVFSLYCSRHESRKHCQIGSPAMYRDNVLRGKTNFYVVLFNTYMYCFLSIIEIQNPFHSIG